MSENGKKSSRRAALEKMIEKARNAVPSTCNNISKYEKIAKIGEGTYGEVFKARDRSTGEVVALKKILTQNEKEGFPITTLREVKTLQFLKHNNIVNLIEVCQQHEENNFITTFYLVFEFCEHDLTGLIQNTDVKFSLGEKKMIMKQLLNGLFFLHAKSVLHRDIKSSNILVTKDGVVKLADFGLSRALMRKEQKKYTPTVVTLWYRPPEVLLGDREYGPPVDIWAAGCIMAELWTRHPILPGSSEIHQLKLIIQLCGSIQPDTWPGVENLELYREINLPRDAKRKLQSRLQTVVNDNHAMELLDKMLTIYPKKRIDCDSALYHDFFYTDPLPCKIELSQYKRSMFNYFPPNSQNGHTQASNKMQKAPSKNEDYYERVF